VSRELSSSDALRAVIEELLVVVADYKEEVTIFFQERRFLDTPAFAPVRAKRDQCDARFVALIEEAQSGGGFRALPSARLMAFGINGMCTWAYQWYRPDGMSAREVGQMYADVLLYGMLDDQARKRRPQSLIHRLKDSGAGRHPASPICRPGLSGTTSRQPWGPASDPW